MKKTMTKDFRDGIDVECVAEYNALKTGMRVRNANGWTGIIVAKLPVKERNFMGFIGQVTVKVDDITEGNSLSRQFAKVGQTITSPAGNFKPFSSGLKFSCGKWKQGE